VIAAAAEKRLHAALPIVPVGVHYATGKRTIARLRLGRALYAGEFSSRKSLVCVLEEEVKKLSLSGQSGRR
jgi:hypothetical protein